MALLVSELTLDILQSQECTTLWTALGKGPWSLEPQGLHCYLLAWLRGEANFSQWAQEGEANPGL